MHQLAPLGDPLKVILVSISPLYQYRLICKTGTLKSTVLIGSALQSVNFDHSFQNFPSPSIHPYSPSDH